MRRPFKITAYGYAKGFSRGDRFKLDPFDGHPREARGSALKARADLLALRRIQLQMVETNHECSRPLVVMC